MHKIKPVETKVEVVNLEPVLTNQIMAVVSSSLKNEPTKKDLAKASVIVKKPEPMFKVVLTKKMQRPQTTSDLFKRQMISQQLLETQFTREQVMSPYTSSLLEIGLKVRKIRERKPDKQDIRRIEAAETEATARHEPVVEENSLSGSKENQKRTMSAGVGPAHEKQGPCFSQTMRSQSTKKMNEFYPLNKDLMASTTHLLKTTRKTFPAFGNLERVKLSARTK